MSQEKRIGPRLRFIAFGWVKQVDPHLIGFDTHHVQIIGVTELFLKMGRKLIDLNV